MADAVALVQSAAFQTTAELLASGRTSGAASPIEIDFLTGGFMDILAAIKREEKKLEKQLGKLQHQLNGVRAAAKALGDSTSKELKVVKKRVMSAAARAKIGKAAKKRWAKFRAQAKKVTG